MIIGIDTSTAVCRLNFVDGDEVQSVEWEIGRELADKLIPYLREQLKSRGKVWNDLTGIVVCKGPGSFTGLRIGLTVMNTIADSNDIPIVGEAGEVWFETALKRLKAGENDQLVMPEYGRGPNITTPRK
jgi:tRNA threonylcarbamoyladenosine biosynthesis protein TsaB